MNNKKRGLSPVIATVLLVAIVVVMGLIIFLFFRAFAPEVATKMGQNIALTCENVNFAADYSSEQISITNDGNVPIYDFEIKVTNEVAKSTTTKELSKAVSGWEKYGLGAGDSFSESFSTNSGDTLLVIPILLGTSEEGESIYTCDEQYGQEITVVA